MQKNKKIIYILFLIIIILSFCSTVFGGNFTDKIVTDKTISADTEVKTKFNQAIGIIQVIAVGIGVIMLTVIAIKYIAAAPSEKASIKKSATIYVVGAVLIFGSAGILQIIKEFSENLFTTK